MRWPSQRMGLTFRPWRRSRAKKGWQTIAAMGRLALSEEELAASRARACPYNTGEAERGDRTPDGAILWDRLRRILQLAPCALRVDGVGLAVLQAGGDRNLNPW